MPTNSRKGFAVDEADDSVVSQTPLAETPAVDKLNPPELSAAASAGDAAANTSATETGTVVSSPAPRRRRGGRRVVRGAGAAGASLELQVQERTPLFEEPALPEKTADKTNVADDEPEETKSAKALRPVKRSKTVAKSSAKISRTAAAKGMKSSDSADAADDEELASRSRRRVRSGRDDYDEYDEYAENKPRVSRRRAAAHDDDDRLVDVVDALPERDEPDERDAAHRGRPMTSLLFQEPVLPVRRSRAAAHDDDYEDDD